MMRSTFFIIFCLIVYALFETQKSKQMSTVDEPTPAQEADVEYHPSAKILQKEDVNIGRPTRESQKVESTTNASSATMQVAVHNKQNVLNYKKPVRINSPNATLSVTERFKAVNKKRLKFLREKLELSDSEIETLAKYENYFGGEIARTVAGDQDGKLKNDRLKKLIDDQAIALRTMLGEERYARYFKFSQSAGYYIAAARSDP